MLAVEAERAREALVSNSTVSAPIGTAGMSPGGGHARDHQVVVAQTHHASTGPVRADLEVALRQVLLLLDLDDAGLGPPRRPDWSAPPYRRARAGSRWRRARRARATPRSIRR